MTALTANATKSFGTIKLKSFSQASSTTIYQHSIVAIVLGTGKVQAATGADNELVIGRALRKNVQSASSPNVEVELMKEIVGLWCVNDTGTAVAAADIGKLCYVLDDQTVTMAATPKGVAGRVWDVSATDGVLVEPLASSPAPTQAATITLAYVTNDCVMTAAQCINRRVFDVPTTAAASTITLPVTGVPDGTTLTFVADATKNGHTVTYRFGTTAITAALTASKIHRVQVTKLGTGWGATSTVSP